MKKLAHTFVIVLVLFCVGTTETFSYTLQEAVSSERCDDLRETEEFRISINNIKVSKIISNTASKVFQQPVLKSTAAICPPVQSLFQFLYLRYRVLRH
jgi:hypothetical protein